MKAFRPFRVAMAVALAATIAVGVVSSTSAADAEGTVESVGLDRRLLTLVDGETFILAEAVEAEEIKVGEDVFIVFELDDREQKVALEVLLTVQE
ncbi:MAG: DUF1344 domain-containing protein [Proteobacteria bacterium]|nr:DUF1344 domain-containing protein [Pseudomonadota bacterium]MDA1058673.1 DUF1344 domain-containing protein [Pseudomonadota bacterium]